MRRVALIALTATAVPAHAQQMTAQEARSFVVGKIFTYQCFEGTRGAGRITDSGAVSGTIQFRGNGATRYAILPQNTIHIVGDRVCASVKGIPLDPCFDLIKTSHNSFRGSLSGLGFVYCDFVRRDRPMIASERPRRRTPVSSAQPMDLQAKPETTAPVATKPSGEKSAETRPPEEAAKSQ